MPLLGLLIYIDAMNHKKFVGLSNTVGLVSIVALIYWVFIFITTEVFGLRIFRENISETFGWSILGILALMFGALIMNVMFNLTRIAEKRHGDEKLPNVRRHKLLRWGVVVSFPVLIILLFTGDYLSTKKRERMLIRSAHTIVDDHSQKLKGMLAYSFDRVWMKQTGEDLLLLGKTDKHFPNVSIIVCDTIRDTPFYLEFDRNEAFNSGKNEKPPQKRNFIVSTTAEERAYLNNVFRGVEKEPRFSAHDGNYELFYPYMANGRCLVLYFSDYRRYGKIGS